MAATSALVSHVVTGSVDISFNVNNYTVDSYSYVIYNVVLNFRLYHKLVVCY